MGKEKYAKINLNNIDLYIPNKHYYKATAFKYNDFIIVQSNHNEGFDTKMFYIYKTKEKTMVLFNELKDYDGYREALAYFKDKESAFIYIDSNYKTEIKSEEEIKDKTEKFEFMPNNVEINFFLDNINKGGDINLEDEQGHSALSTAIVYGFEQFYNKFIDLGANPYYKIQGIKPVIHLAVQNCEIEFLKCLDTKGFDLDCVDDEGLTSLMLCGTLSNKNEFKYQVFDLLINNGSNINEYECIDNRSVLMFYRDDFPLFKKLVNLGADLYHKNDNDENIFDMCTKNGYEKQYNFLKTKEWMNENRESLEYIDNDILAIIISDDNSYEHNIENILMFFHNVNGPNNNLEIAEL